MQNPQQMPQMAGMNPAAGGPVGPVNNGPHQGRERDPLSQLNTYIYDYFLRNNHLGLAKLMLDEDLRMHVHRAEDQKPTNGMDASGSLKDLPSPALPENYPVENSFLLDWWSQFWDIFSAARKPNPSTVATKYLTHSRNLAFRNDPSNRIMINGGVGMNPNAMNYRTLMLNGAAGPPDLKRAAAMNSRNPSNPAQMANMNQMRNQGMTAANMARDPSGMDMNGQRPQSPASTENAPSPSKRPRVDGGNFNGQQMGTARTQGMPQQPMGATSQGPANPMLIGSGMNTGNQFGEFQPGQQKSLQVYAQSLAEQQRSFLNNHGLSKEMHAGVQQSQMNTQTLDGSTDIYAGNQGRPMNGGTSQPQSNHALQDYQMQLMLLEQQNKKRLLLARQEQDSLTSQQGPHGQPVGAAGYAPAMSPQGSRAGPSPNPSDQMGKRGTPKMNQQGLPGSPMPDGSMPPNRNSPVPNFDPMAPGVPPQFYPQQMHQNPMMRPPSSHPNFNGVNGFTPQQMDAIRNGNMANGNMQGGNWPRPPQQMMPNQGQQQPQQQQPGAMNPGPQRGNPMPPPPAPAGEQPGRPQEPSPQQPAPAPPTPNQTNKTNPRKKDTKDNKKKSVKKNAATAAAQVPETEAPTPTPPTPVTPMAPASFNNKQNGQGQQHQQQQQQQLATQQVPAPQAPQVQPPQMDGGPFSHPGDDGTFPTLDGLDGIVGDGFETFDFDSFLNQEDPSAFGSLEGFNFGTDGVEAGNGDLN